MRTFVDGLSDDILVHIAVDWLDPFVSYTVYFRETDGMTAGSTVLSQLCRRLQTLLLPCCQRGRGPLRDWHPHSPRQLVSLHWTDWHGDWPENDWPRLRRLSVSIGHPCFRW